MNLKRTIGSAIAVGVLALAACSSGTTSTANPTCRSEPLPAAGASCVVAGSYTARQTPKCPNTCGTGGSRTVKGVTVTVTGTDVVIAFKGVDDRGDQTEGNANCTITSCECVSTSGAKTIFTDTGWTSDAITSVTFTKEDAGGGACTTVWEATRD
jgi:hypothetical protein